MGLRLKPKTANAPAKVKDLGVIGLVKNGDAAFNAKTGELLLLPDGADALRRIKERLAARLFGEASLQYVECGGDEAVFSLAERYVREWGDASRSFLDERGRELRLIGWSKDILETEDKTAAIMRAVEGELDELCGGGKFAFVEETLPDDVRSFSLVSPCETGSLGARPGFLCRSCKKMLLADSPFEFRGPQPGEGEEEESLEDIETPGANTIAELCSQLGIDIERTIKAMLYVATDKDAAAGIRPVASFVRGDYNISMNKISRLLRKELALFGLRTAEKQELQELIGEVAGYCGPIGLPESVFVVYDNSVTGAKNTVAGANRTGFHRKGCCQERDFKHATIDIAQVCDNMPCVCGGSFESAALRESGVLRFGFNPANVSGSDIPDGESAIFKKLTYKDRDGAYEYPFVWRGVLSTEKILLEADLAL
jgi:prolyl-tRNA synthetase